MASNESIKQFMGIRQLGRRRSGLKNLFGRVWGGFSFFFFFFLGGGGGGCRALGVLFWGLGKAEAGNLEKLKPYSIISCPPNIVYLHPLPNAVPLLLHARQLDSCITHSRAARRRGQAPKPLPWLWGYSSARLRTGTPQTSPLHVGA